MLDEERELELLRRLEEERLREKRAWEDMMERDELARYVAALVLKLPEVERLTDEACEFANGKVGDAVNWADLNCVEALLVVSLDGDVYFQVTVSEASPQASDFQEFVRKYLEDRGFKARVITEW